jgi:hypothetical protein
MELFSTKAAPRASPLCQKYLINGLRQYGVLRGCGRSDDPDRQLELPTETYIGHPARCGEKKKKTSNYTLSFSKHYRYSYFLQTIGLEILIYCRRPFVIMCITCYFSFKVCNNRLNPALFLYVVRSSFRNFPKFSGIIYMNAWLPGPWPS